MIRVSSLCGCSCAVLLGFQAWSIYEEPKEVEVVEEPVERKVNYAKVVVTEVTDRFTFFAQKVENGTVMWIFCSQPCNQLDVTVTSKLML